MKENDFMCPACKMGKLGHTPNNDLQCNICNKIYPKILGIPVLVDEPKKLIALTYWHYLDGLAKIDNQIAELSLSSNFPSNEKQKQVSALTTNKSLLLELKDILEKQFHVSMIPSLRSSDNMSLNYVTNFDYLKRDWTFLPHYEKEISNILENLTASIKSLEGIAKKPKILFLGAGTGRIAYELAKQYSEITAIDRSLLMSSLFQKVQTENIEFCEVTFKNVERESVSNYSIEAKKNITSKIDKVRYVTGDASNLPFQKDNFDIIISVYFSDVLPLGYFFPEVKRVLKPNGAFIHLGPLNYHFNNLDSMYTYKDLKEIIKSNGFKITYDASYLDRHCMSLNSELVQKYKIWVLATQKDLTEEINLDSVLKLSLNPISFTITGDLTSNDNIVKIKVNEWVELENKPFLLDIIKLIDGKRSISNILEYFDDVQKEDISILFDCLLKLSNYNLIEIMDKPKY